MDERAPRRAAQRYCFAIPGGPSWRCALHSARLSGLAPIRRVPPGPAPDHDRLLRCGRLLRVGPRRWEALMLRSRVTELHYITPVANLGSIVTHGVLSHNLAKLLPHVSIADADVQNRRAGKHVPRGRRLHDYANLYFDARNPMMYTLKKNSDVPLTVIRLDPAVLDLPDSLITDGNAAARDTRFLPSPGGLDQLKEDLVYAVSWDDQDSIQKIAKGRARCAELLVPDRVEPRFVLGCYVDRRNRRSECASQSPGVLVEVNTYVFFG